MRRLLKPQRSWPLLAIFTVTALSAGFTYFSDRGIQASLVLIIIGSITFGSWLVTEILWVFKSMSEREDNE